MWSPARVLVVDASDHTALVLLPPKSPRPDPARGGGGGGARAAWLPIAVRRRAASRRRELSGVKSSALLPSLSAVALLLSQVLRGLPPDAAARRAALAHAGGALARRVGAFLAAAPRDAAATSLAPLVRDAERHAERHAEAVPGAGWATRHRHPF